MKKNNDHNFKEVEEKIELLNRMQAIDSQAALKQVKFQISKQKSISINNLLLKIAAILILPLLLFSLWQNHELNSQKLVINTIETPATLRSTFTLPDGTKVWLNGNSTLTYPTKFNSKERLVKLKGEAFFDVVTNPQKPFHVEMESITVEAVGTQFNCSFIDKEKDVEVLLVEGKVNVYSNDNWKKITALIPNELLIFNQRNSTATINYVEPEKHIAWINGQLIFKDDPLLNVLTKLERWYNVEFILEKNLNNDYAFTGSFYDEELGQILNYIELTTPIQFERQKNIKNNNNTYSKTKIEIHSK